MKDNVNRRVLTNSIRVIIDWTQLSICLSLSTPKMRQRTKDSVNIQVLTSSNRVLDWTSLNSFLETGLYGEEIKNQPTWRVKKLFVYYSKIVIHFKSCYYYDRRIKGFLEQEKWNEIGVKLIKRIRIRIQTWHLSASVQNTNGGWTDGHSGL